MPTLEEAIEYIRMGNREEGRQMLEEILEEDENNEEVWLWLSSVVEADEDREICLENVLALNPDNMVAKKGLEALQSGTFNVNDLLSEVLEVGEEEEATFIDDFIIGDDDELEMPSTMAKSKPKAKKKSGGLNIRLIILGVLILFLILVLAGVAGVALLSGGGNGGEEIPAGVTTEAPQPEETPIPTDTPTPAPTDTPTSTPTSSLQLPTAAPTVTPSPTATTVVSPTPSN